VPEYVALPYPPEPVIAHYGAALDVEARVRRELEWFELARVLPELLEEQGPRDAQEWRHAGVAHEVRHVRVPIIYRRVMPKHQHHRRERNSRVRHLLRKRERTLNRRQVEQMDRDDEVLAECSHTLFPSWCAPPH
jgi:hypothetical protein